jgi:hypothetical protein
MDHDKMCRYPATYCNAPLIRNLLNVEGERSTDRQKNVKITRQQNERI